MDTVVVREVSELEAVARTLLAMVPRGAHASVVTLTGDLGAGKTAFTKALARVLGITENVTSPTFVIMKSYDIPPHADFTTLTHIDAYRIEAEAELSVLGFAEILGDPKQLIVIEWPERVPMSIPAHALTVRIEIGTEGERIITYGN